MDGLIVEVIDVTKAYGERVLDGVTLSVDSGEVVGLVGPNGCGKTTLLRIVAGLESQDSGVVERRGRVGIVFQDDRLLPWRTLWENIALGMKYNGLRGRELVSRVRRYSELVGLREEDLALFPRKASGGTRRKAALARALSLEPDILLLDEPFTGLDVASREALRETLRGIWRGTSVATLIVSHQLEELLPLVDRVYVLTPKPAKVAHELDLRGRGLEDRVNLVRDALLRMLSG